MNAESSPVALRVVDARKSFGSTQALSGASLELQRGELLALLGPNGAGKTTLLRAVAGRVRLDGGRIDVLGVPVEGGRTSPALGVVPQDVALYPLLTARENLEVFASLNGVTPSQRAKRVASALEWTQLAERARDRVGTFSGGMKRRLNIACGVLHEPQVVLLDEPTVGVDPQSRERIYDMLKGLRDRGVSLLLTTHQLEEAETRCDRIAILDHGTIAATGTLSELVRRTSKGAREIAFTVDRRPAVAPPGLTLAEEGPRLTARIGDLTRELPDLVARVQGAGLALEDIEVQRHGLHEVFLQLTGKELRE